MDNTLLYYAYGSNLHPARLGARIPSSELLGIATLSGYQLRFHKRGGDLSAKCNALYSGDPAHQLLGALFRMSPAEKPLLDEIEGPGYGVSEVEVEHAGLRQYAFMYVAEAAYIDDQLAPFQWYKDFVYLGGRYHNFPEAYLREVAAVQAVDDHDTERHARNAQVIQLMR